MSTYVVGDIQGCYEPLCRLLEVIKFDSARDTLLSVGDLINRGPNNIGVLRLLRSLGSQFRAVLGNHDLNFLAVEARLSTTEGQRHDARLARQPRAPRVGSLARPTAVGALARRPLDRSRRRGLGLDSRTDNSGTPPK